MYSRRYVGPRLYIYKISMTCVYKEYEENKYGTEAMTTTKNEVVTLLGYNMKITI